jgi:transposase InsO family protein
MEEMGKEVIAQRQQIHEFLRKHPKPRLGRGFRIYWVLLSRLWPRWKEAFILVKPSTVIAWHRAGFRIFWKWKSRKKTGRKPIQAEMIELIRRMAEENRWGAPRIHGELWKLGFCVSESTVSRYMPKCKFKGDDLQKRQQNWRTFLHNHRDVITAMDFLVVPTWRFGLLYVLVILDHGRRIVRHFNVTAHPTAEWVKNQLREAFPYQEIPNYLIYDRDTIFCAVKRFVETFGIEAKITAYRCPWQNGACERLIGTLRRELFDHVIVLNEDHARRLLKGYFVYYHQNRTHLGLNKDSPRGRPVEECPGGEARVIALPKCGGLHHRYTWNMEF